MAIMITLDEAGGSSPPGHHFSLHQIFLVGKSFGLTASYIPVR